MILTQLFCEVENFLEKCDRLDELSLGSRYS
jgi:hypothetical protein